MSHNNSYFLFQGEAVFAGETLILQNDHHTKSELFMALLLKDNMSAGSFVDTNDKGGAPPCPGASCHFPTMPFVSSHCRLVTAAC